MSPQRGKHPSKENNSPGFSIKNQHRDTQLIKNYHSMRRIWQKGNLKDKTPECYDSIGDTPVQASSM